MTDDLSGDVTLVEWTAERAHTIAPWLTPDAEWKRWDAPYLPGPSADSRDEFLDRLVDGDRWMCIECGEHPVGLVSWHWEDESAGWRRLGIVIYDPAYWSRGIGTAALRMWADRLRSLPGTARLDLATWSGNERMIGSALRLGWREEARLTGARVVDGRRYDSIVLAIPPATRPGVTGRTDEEPTSYPAAHREDRVDTLHGEEVADPYRWLEDGDSERTRAWDDGQADLFAAHQAAWPTRTHFHARMTNLLATGSISPPVPRGDQQFILRRDPDQEHAALLVVDRDNHERVLVDPMAIDPEGMTTLDTWQPSKDGRLLAYQTSHGGTEESMLTVIDTATGATVEGPIDRCRYSPVAWLPDSRGYYYVRQLPRESLPADERQYHRRVWFHPVGADPAMDTMIFGADHDKTTFFGVTVSLDGHWLVVSAALGTAPRNEVWIADLYAAALTFTPVATGLDARTSAWVARDGRLYIHTDEGAPRGHLLVADPADPTVRRELIPQHPESVMEDVVLVDGRDLLLYVAWTRHAVSEVTIHDAQIGAPLGDLDLPGIGSISGLHVRPEGGSDLWFAYTDHVTPATVHHHDALTQRTRVAATPPGRVPETDGIVTGQATFTSHDGTAVRMFVIRRGDSPQPAPAILYGYGGFGISLTPAYSAQILAWVEAGGTYAVANLRGGGEEGEAWHRAGMRGDKQRVFDDFHAAAEHLVDIGITSPDRLAIHGGSNGGLLVGAALTQRPDLYRAVVCSAPLLDMVRYELAGLGRLWTDEFGSADDPGELGWLLTYSPYHRIRTDLAYPATLFTVFASDTRVDPLHARKMCAALQHATTGDPATHPVLMRLEGQAGHGARSVSRTTDLSADTLAFTAWATRLTPDALETS